MPTPPNRKSVDQILTETWRRDQREIEERRRQRELEASMPPEAEKNDDVQVFLTQDADEEGEDERTAGDNPALLGSRANSHSNLNLNTAKSISRENSVVDVNGIMNRDALKSQFSDGVVYDRKLDISKVKMPGRKDWYDVGGRPQFVVPPPDPAAHPYFGRTKPLYMRVRDQVEQDSLEQSAPIKTFRAAGLTKHKLPSAAPKGTFTGMRPLSSARRTTRTPDLLASTPSIPPKGMEGGMGLSLRGATARRAPSRERFRAVDDFSRRATPTPPPSEPGVDVHADAGPARIERIFEKRFSADNDGTVELFCKATFQQRAPRYLWIHEADLPPHVDAEVLEEVEWAK